MPIHSSRAVRVLLLCLSIRGASAAAAAEGQLDANRTLFSVFAALNAARYDAGLHTAFRQELREQVRAALEAREIPCREELKHFVAARRKKDPAAEMSQYVSFALSVEAAPSFEWRFQRSEIPPDALPLDGFGQLLARFDQEAGIDELWRRSQPAIERELERYHTPVSQAVLQVNAYLRNVTSGFLGRRFQVYLELLAEPDQTQSRSYGEDYFVVVSPASEPQTDPIRHGYLHYLLDPLALKYHADWEKKRGVGDYALGSPLLDDSFKNDFLLLGTESLIKAIEARLGPASQRAARVDQALREGFVLAPYFAEALVAYEKQEDSFKLRYREMVSAIDLRNEEVRLDRVEFASTPAPLNRKPAPDPPPLPPAEQALEQAQAFAAARNLEAAKAAYKRALELSDQKPLHALCFFGLGRIAALEKDPEAAERLFEKTLESEPEPNIRSWAYVYLARLAEKHTEADPREAIRLYQAALAVQGGSPAARKAAEAGLKLASQRNP